MDNNIKRPKVGLGVAVIKDGKVLQGKRKGSQGAATWAFPGGHLEFGESIEDCARREVMEETSLKIKNIKHLDFTNDIFDEEKHYITLFVVADYDSGDVTLCEPDKCERWEWFDWDNLPKPLFLTEQHLLEQDVKRLLKFQGWDV